MIAVPIHFNDQIVPDMTSRSSFKQAEFNFFLHDSIFFEFFLHNQTLTVLLGFFPAIEVYLAISSRSSTSFY